MTIVVVRPVLNELQHLVASLDVLRSATSSLAIVLVGGGQYQRDEIEHTLGVEVLGVLPEDRGTAEAMNSATATLSKLTRSPLIRAARSLALTIESRGISVSAADLVSEETISDVSA